MTENYLVKIFEHNNWANTQIIQACYALTDEQLDAEPQSATMGSIRQTLQHLVNAQQAYLSLLTIPVEARQRVRPEFTELQESANKSGEGLLSLVGGELSQPVEDRLQLRDGSYVEPWVVLLEAINHATEHREQIKSMLTALDVTPPEVDAWDYGVVTKAFSPASS